MSKITIYTRENVLFLQLNLPSLKFPERVPSFLLLKTQNEVQSLQKRDSWQVCYHFEMNHCVSSLISETHSVSRAKSAIYLL